MSRTDGERSPGATAGRMLSGAMKARQAIDGVTVDQAAVEKFRMFSTKCASTLLKRCGRSRVRDAERMSRA
jgi:hypothetical protein